MPATASWDPVAPSRTPRRSSVVSRGFRSCQSETTGDHDEPGHTFRPPPCCAAAGRPVLPRRGNGSLGRGKSALERAHFSHHARRRAPDGVPRGRERLLLGLNRWRGSHPPERRRRRSVSAGRSPRDVERAGIASEGGRSKYVLRAEATPAAVLLERHRWEFNDRGSRTRPNHGGVRLLGVRRETVQSVTRVVAARNTHAGPCRGR